MPAIDSRIVSTYRSLDDLVPAHWRTGTTSARDGTALHWTETGTGTPVVLLHGLQVDGLSWLRTARALESRYRVIMPDLRGHGRSGPPTSRLSPETLVDDLRLVMGTLGVHRPLVVGHSFGADVGAWLAAAEDVRGLVLVDPALHDVAAATGFDPDAPPPWMRSLFDAISALPSLPHRQRMEAGLRLLPPGTPPWGEADHVTFVEGQARFDLDFYRYMPGDRASAAPDVIAAIGCPILLLTACPALPGVDVEAAVGAFTEHWRDGRHVHLPDSGHAIHFEQFGRFIALLEGFLDGAE